MIRVFLDVNVALDLIVEREPFYDDAKYLFDVRDARAIKLMVSSSGVANMIYTANKSKIENPNIEIWQFLELCDIASACKSTLFTAFHSQFRDKEDASEYFTALDNHADYFLTRDIKDYKKSLSPILPVLTPVQLKDIVSGYTIFAPSSVMLKS